MQIELEVYGLTEMKPEAINSNSIRSYSPVYPRERSAGRAGEAAVSPPPEFVEEAAAKEDLAETVEFLNEIGGSLSPRRIQFNILPEENIVQARILHRETEELIRAIPADELLEMRKKITEFIGILFDSQG